MRPARRHRQRGLTILEVIIVIAIVGSLMFLGANALRMMRDPLLDETLEFASVLQRTGQLAIEHGKLHRVVIDFDKKLYAVEVCEGSTTMTRGQKDDITDPSKVEDALVEGQQKLRTAGAGQIELASDPEQAAKMAAAVTGHHVADRICGPAAETPGPGALEIPVRQLSTKFKAVWVQHLDDSVTTGVVALHFFPVGSAEKAIVELTDGDETLSVLLHGLTRRVEVRDGELRNSDDHMLKNAAGDKEAEREEPK
jgi:prepilin-type N-terminal cleavage/methylation domain-containing protein